GPGQAAQATETSQGWRDGFGTRTTQHGAPLAISKWSLGMKCTEALETSLARARPPARCSWLAATEETSSAARRASTPPSKAKYTEATATTGFLVAQARASFTVAAGKTTSLAEAAQAKSMVGMSATIFGVAMRRI